MVLVYLCEEANDLIHVAESTHFPTLTIFGESVSPKGDQEPVGPGDRERNMGKMLYSLQVKST